MLLIRSAYTGVVFGGLPLRRNVLMICLAVFLADVVWSVLSPTFSLFAQDIGATLPFIGILSGITGLTQLLLAVPIGTQSDRIGRRKVILIGFALFSIACVAHAISTAAWMLVPARIVFAVSTLAVFPTCGVMLADVTEPRERGAAFGMLTTSMSCGAAAGAWLAGALGGWIGIAQSYWVAGGIAALGLLITWATLRDKHAPDRSTTRLGLPAQYARMLPLLKNPALLFTSSVSMITSICFQGVIMSFFPIHAVANGATSAGVSNMFSVRSVGSMLTRLPLGILSQRMSRPVLLMLCGLTLAVLVVAMAFAQSPEAFTILLVLEGIMFGGFLTVGQSYATEAASVEDRAASIALYQTAGSLGATLSPLLLGIVADKAGIPIVFIGVGIFSIVVIVLSAFQLRRHVNAAKI